MKHYQFTLPKESEDFLVQRTCTKTKVIQELFGVFSNIQAMLIETPALEYARLFTDVLHGFQEKELLLWVNDEGETLAFRPEYTLPIARIVTSKLGFEAMRLCYSGTVFRRQEKYSGRSVEKVQCGVEVLGAVGEVCDESFEILQVIQTACQRLNLSKVLLTYSDVRLVQRFLSVLGCDDEKRDGLQNALEYKNSSYISSFIKTIELPLWQERMLLYLPHAFGGQEVLWKLLEYSEDAVLSEIIHEMIAFWKRMEVVYKTSPINGCVDAIGIAKRGYYTSTLLEGYIENQPFPMFQGGQYDTLYGLFGSTRCAVGLTFDVSELSVYIDRLKGGGECFGLD